MNRNPFSDDKTEVKYPAEVAEFLTVFTNDRRYIDTTDYIVERKQKGDAVTMCTIAQALEDRGIKKGELRGIKKGRLEGEIGAIYSLLNKRIITPDIAAEELNISLNDLDKVFSKYGFGSGN